MTCHRQHGTEPVLGDVPGWVGETPCQQLLGLSKIANDRQEGGGFKPLLDRPDRGALDCAGEVMSSADMVIQFEVGPGQPEVDRVGLLEGRILSRNHTPGWS